MREMNRKWVYATLVLVALVVVISQQREAVGFGRVELAVSDDAPTSGNSPALSGSSPARAGRVDEAHTKDVRTSLEAIVEGLKQMGLKQAPPIAKSLKEAIATGDPGTMRRAFHEAIYGRFAKMSEAIPVIAPYLDSSEPYVQYLAAEALLRVGEKSGVETLLKMVQSDEAIPQGARDLRFAAAAALGTFDITEAAAGIRDLYSRTKHGELLMSLASLGIQANEASSWPYVPGSLAIENYAKVGSTRFAPQIASTFEQSNDPTIKNAAAWALARMTGKDLYVDYLIEVARQVIESEEEESNRASTEALRYLGSIQSPKAVSILEDALKSQNPIAVRYATVNLLFNQPGGSKKARQLVVRELKASPRTLGTDLVMQIASKSGNPEIHAAAKSYARRTANDRWRYWGVERSTWPVQNWINDYVVTLKP